MVAGNNLLFPKHVSGNEYGQYDGNRGVFTAPIDGRFAFSFHLYIYGGSGGYYNRIDMKRSGTTIHYFQTSGTRDSSWDSDVRQFNVEVDMTKGQTIELYIYSAKSGIKYSYVSTMEGKLVKQM